MAREIFRKAALERLAGPERTDRPIRLVGAPGWLLLGVLTLAVSGGMAWTLGTRAALKIAGSGILIGQAGLVEVSSVQGGVLQEVRLVPGEMIEIGAPVATLSRAELDRELAAAEAALRDLQDRYIQLEAAHAARSAREAQADAIRRSTIATTREALSDRLKLLSDRVSRLAPLAARKVVPELRLIEAEISVADVNERLAELNEQMQKIGLDAADRDSQRAFERLEDRLAIEEQERLIARLSGRLDDERVIRSRHRGRVVEIKVNAGDVLRPGAALATLAPAGRGRDLQAVMYVPPRDGKRVAPGMVAEIQPTTVEPEVYGHIVGEVVSVAPLPATPEGMRRTLQNDQLVEQLSLGGAPIEVRLSLTTDPSTPSGFLWSSSRGPLRGVNAGTLLDGKVVVEERPVLDLVLPGAVSTLGFD